VAEIADNKLDELMNKLMPVLMRAIQGDFTGRIEMEKGDPLNEIYAGVQTLLDVICEQIKILDELSPTALHWTSHYGKPPPEGQD